MSSRSLRRRDGDHPPSKELIMAFRPYLTFAGNAREAFTKYQTILGGELVVLGLSDMPGDAEPPPPGVSKDAVMHAALMVGDDVLMGADDMGGNYKGKA